MAKCQRCRALFHPWTRRQNYCSSACYGRSIRVTKQPRACARCASRFKASSSKQRFCGQKCSGAASSDRWSLRRPTLSSIKCERCERRFTRRHKASAQRYCSIRCAGDARMGGRQCVRCGVVFRTDGRKQRWCSVACAAKDRTKERDKRPCLQCGASFVVPQNYPQQVYCDRACADKHRKFSKTCWVCKGPFMAWRSNGSICGRAKCRRAYSNMSNYRRRFGGDSKAFEMAKVVALVQAKVGGRLELDRAR